MTLTIENILFLGSILLLVSIIAGKTSYKFGVPTLVLFLLVGMMAGSEGVGGIYFSDPEIAQFIGIVSLNFILFSGGLDTDWKTIKPVLKHGIALSTVGVLITALSLGVFVSYILNFTIYEGLLLGAIVSSTDAAAVFSILRAKSLALKSNLRPTLELESGSNDPMAYGLTILFLSMVTHPNKDLWSAIPVLIQQMVIGGLGGYLFGKLSKWLINGIKLDFEGLYPVLVIALMFITFSSTDVIGGNGFLAVYICAVYLGNHEIIHKKSVLKMFDGLAWLMQIILFLTLGLLVYPSHIVPVIEHGLLISIFLILVARPISVFISLSFFKINFRKKMFLSWVGLRGAVPIVFATYPLIAGINKADLIFNIVFFVSLTSVLLQGTTLGKIADWLHVSLPQNLKRKEPIDELVAETMKTAMHEIKLDEENKCVGKKLVELNFPKSAIIAMIKRKDKFFTPNGSTILQSNDVLIIISNTEQSIDEVYSCLKINRNREE